MSNSDSTNSTPQAEGVGCGDDVPADVHSNDAGATGRGNQSITFSLECDKKGDNQIEIKEVGKLVYNRLMAPPRSLITYCDAVFMKLTIILKPHVDVSKLILTQALEIRPGLRTKPVVAENKEKEVHIYWAPLSLSNSAIADSLETWGTLHNYIDDNDKECRVWNKVYKAKEDDDDITKMMDGVIMPDRMCRMVVTHPIPSHILVGGVKIKISYQGQARTCGRCYKYWSNCPGGGKTSVCKAKEEAANKEREEAGGKPVKAPTMKNHWKKVEKKLEKKMKNGVNVGLSEATAGRPPPPTCVRVSSLPEDITLPEFINLLKANNCDIAEIEDKIQFDNAAKGTAVIRDLDEIDFALIVENINGVHLRGKRFKVVPVQEATPEKAQEEPQRGGGAELMEVSSPPPSSALSTASPETAGAAGTSPVLAMKVSKNTLQSNHANETLRTPNVGKLVSHFQEVVETQGGSKHYSRIVEGKEITSRKALRSSDLEDSPTSKTVLTNVSNVTTRAKSKKKLKQ